MQDRINHIKETISFIQNNWVHTRLINWITLKFKNGKV